jgi:hypothetical protein
MYVLPPGRYTLLHGQLANECTQFEPTKRVRVRCIMNCSHENETSTTFQNDSQGHT